LTSDVPYRQAVGALMYVGINTVPGAAYAINRAAKYVENPRESHWRAVKRIFRFLKGVVDTHGITYRKTTGKPTLSVYCDADYAEDIDTRKSTSGYVAFMAGAPVAWRSAQQTGTALSTCVSELYALTEATVQVMWHRQLLKDLHFEQTEPTVIQEDNQAAIAACENDVVTRRIKCVGVRLSFLRDQIKEGIFELEDCPSCENIADIFTKALPISTFEYHAAKLM